MSRPIKLLYFFTVEGPSEKRYLEHLQKIINQRLTDLSVEFKIWIDKSARACFNNRRLTIDTYAHFWDREEENKQIEFQDVLNNINNNAIADNIFYCYSNLSFELWLILHKEEYTAPVSNKNVYTNKIRTLYDINVRSHTDVTKEKNFSRLLAQISLNDVLMAIRRADRLRQSKQNVCSPFEFYASSGKIVYYPSNPDTLVQEVVKKILQDCHLLQ